MICIPCRNSIHHLCENPKTCPCQHRAEGVITRPEN